MNVGKFHISWDMYRVTASKGNHFYKNLDILTFMPVGCLHNLTLDKVHHDDSRKMWSTRQISFYKERMSSNKMLNFTKHMECSGISNLLVSRIMSSTSAWPSREIPRFWVWLSFSIWSYQPLFSHIIGGSCSS